MAFPAGFSGILSGFSAKLYVQPNPVSGPLVALSGSDLGVRNLADVTTISANALAIVADANNLNPQNVGSFGFESAEVTLPLAGQRYAQKIPTQSPPASLSLTVTYDPSNLPLVLLSKDADNGVTTRTFIVQSTLYAGATTYNWFRIFNARASAINWTAGPDNAHLAELSIVPIGGISWGYAYNSVSSEF